MRRKPTPQIGDLYKNYYHLYCVIEKDTETFYPSGTLWRVFNIKSGKMCSISEKDIVNNLTKVKQ